MKRMIDAEQFSRRIVVDRQKPRHCEDIKESKGNRNPANIPDLGRRWASHVPRQPGRRSVKHPPEFVVAVVLQTYPSRSGIDF